MEEVNKILRRQADQLLELLHGRPADDDQPIKIDCGVMETSEEKKHEQ
jgi:hypothetical protein